MREKSPQSTQAYNILKRKIITLQLKPGDVLDEKALMESLKIGRTPLREAILTLKAENLVEGRPNKSAVVKDITVKGVRELYEALMPIEKWIVRLASLRITPELLGEVKKCHNRVNRAIEQNDYIGIVYENRNFHCSIAKATNNDYLLSIYSNLQNQLERLSYLAVSQDFQNNSPLGEHVARIRQQHEQYFRCLEKGDPECAEKLAEKHIRLAQNRIRMYLESF